MIISLEQYARNSPKIIRDWKIECIAEDVYADFISPDVTYPFPNQKGEIVLTRSKKTYSPEEYWLTKEGKEEIMYKYRCIISNIEEVARNTFGFKTGAIITYLNGRVESEIVHNTNRRMGKGDNGDIGKYSKELIRTKFFSTYDLRVLKNFDDYVPLPF